VLYEQYFTQKLLNWPQMYMHSCKYEHIKDHNAFQSSNDHNKGK